MSTLWSSVSYALTAGPTAPEATSFEPVDTTDIVNLATGDLTYNIPLLEVPGPSGGYPLSLSYHAGIQPNEEASWVGLGWTLNAGAITRNVNGFADDFDNVKNTSRYYWKGGESKTYEIGVSYGVAGSPASVSAGLSFSQDTYQGFGVGMSIGLGIGLGKNGGPISAGASFGVSPYGQPSASVGINGSMKINEDIGASIGIGLQTNFNTVSGYASSGVSYKYKQKNDSGDEKTGGGSFLNASISTGSKGGAPSIGIGGISMSSNSRAGVTSRSSSGFSVSIPILPVPGLWANLGYSKQRYWIDQTDHIDVSGGLHFPAEAVTKSWLNKHNYDTYSLLDQDSLAKGIDPAKNLGGSLPNFDNYSVNAQGLGGSMRPYFFQKHLIRRNDYVVKEDDDGDEYKDYKVIQYPTGFDTRPAEFRFVGDFSNRFIYDHSTMQTAPSAGHEKWDNPLSYDFDWAEDPVFNESGTEEYLSNRLPGSRHVDWLTNDEILAGSKPKLVGLVTSTASGFNRSTLPGSGIGAFVITNETGVRYHFALPATAYQEYSYSENREESLTFNEFKNPERYAYTWYLTGITGPDYVDRSAEGGPDGILNSYDWGYWVEFEYGKWTDIYTWRNPSEGFNLDQDTKFRNFSEGRKELYYLDAIRTRTHTAYFVKDIRDDAKSTIYALRNIENMPGFLGSLSNREKITSFTKNGGFIPKHIQASCHRNYVTDEQDGDVDYYSRPTSSLKLSEVILLENNKVTSSFQKTGGVEYSQSFSYTWNVVNNEDMPENCDECDFSNVVFNHHLYQNVFDVHDPSVADVRSQAIRVINFETDYSLAPNTSNSFAFSQVNVTSPSTNDGDYVKQGKLTLKKLHFNGKAGVSGIIPPLEFSYDLLNPLSGSGTITQPGGYSSRDFEIQQSNSGLKIGDLLFFDETNDVYAVVTRIYSSSRAKLRIIGVNLPAVNQTHTWRLTKNPPYNKDLFDSWGMYKSDLDLDVLDINEEAARLVSQASAQSLDAWSLRSVQTSIGATISIDYEADTYRKPILSNNQLFRVEKVQGVVGSTDYNITLYDQIADLDKIIATGSKVTCDLLLGDPYVKFILKDFSSRVESLNLTVLDVFQSNGKWLLRVGDLSDYFEPRPGSDGRVYTDPVVLAGNVGIDMDFDNSGGGLRVSGLEIKSLSGTSSSHYHYNKAAVNTSSGVTSYLPGGMDQVSYSFPESGSISEYFTDLGKREKARQKYERIHHGEFAKILANAREIPPPGVMYQFVTVQESIGKPDGSVYNLPTYSTYQFEVFDKGHVGILYSDEDEVELPGAILSSDLDASGYPAYDKIKVRKTTLKNYTALVGSLKSVALYDQSGLKINETINHYLHDGLSADDITSNDPDIDDQFEINTDLYEDLLQNQFSNQGVIHEAFSEARFVEQNYDLPVNGFFETDGFNLLGVLTKREEYPSIQVGQTVVNYKSGITTSSKTLAFDFYSGQTVKSVSVDGLGNTIVKETVPAYRIYPLMGLAAKGGHNMLTQEVRSTTYKVDPTSLNVKLGLVGTGVQTWSAEVSVLDHPELQRTVAFSNIMPKETTGAYKGFYPAFVSSPNTIKVGERFEFVDGANRYQGKVIAADRFIGGGMDGYMCELQLIDPTPEITSQIGYASGKVLPIYREHASYTYIGDDNTPLLQDGLHALTAGSLPSFSSWRKGDAVPANWQKNSEITLYDVQSHALEATDLNTKYAATKMSGDQTRVFATVANSKYDEFGYSGAEEPAVYQSVGKYMFGGGVFVTAFNPVLSLSPQSHTGAYSYAPSNGKGFHYSVKPSNNRTYHVSVWANGPGAAIKYKLDNGSEISCAVKVRQAGNWYQIEADIPVVGSYNSLLVWCESAGLFDDFRVHPIDAAMLSYVYNEWGELSHILDANNLFTEYLYDGMGRLKQVNKETFKKTNGDPTYGNNGISKVSEFDYNYGGND